MAVPVVPSLETLIVELRCACGATRAIESLQSIGASRALVVAKQEGWAFPQSQPYLSPSAIAAICPACKTAGAATLGFDQR